MISQRFLDGHCVEPLTMLIHSTWPVRVYGTPRRQTGPKVGETRLDDDVHGDAHGADVDEAVLGEDVSVW